MKGRWVMTVGEERTLMFIEGKMVMVKAQE
jgi:hypothetical protein